jgi:hypothetical protein
LSSSAPSWKRACPSARSTAPGSSTASPARCAGYLPAPGCASRASSLPASGTPIGRTAGAQRFATDTRFARQTGTAPIPASSGNRTRHRLHRGGDRQPNRALHMIAITRAARDPATHAYLERKITEGKTRKEAIRRLKRHLARRFHQLLTEPEPSTDHQPIPVSAPSPMPCLT